MTPRLQALIILGTLAAFGLGFIIGRETGKLEAVLEDVDAAFPGEDAAASLRYAVMASKQAAAQATTDTPDTPGPDDTDTPPYPDARYAPPEPLKED